MNPLFKSMKLKSLNLHNKQIEGNMTMSGVRTS
jgi:hypothetical protein